MRSERELEVLRLIAEVLSDSDIGAKLFVEVSTVKRHGSHIFAKLDADRLAEPSAVISVRVESALERRRARFRDTRLGANPERGPKEIREHCRLGPSTQSLLKAATQ